MAKTIEIAEDTDYEIDENTVQDILVELTACLTAKGIPANELPGLKAAIEIIQNNYLA